MLNVTGSANLTNITIKLAAQNALTLPSVGETFNLISATGNFTDNNYHDTEITDSFGNTYALTLTAGINNILSAELLDTKSFEDIINDIFGNAGLNNENL